MRKYLIAGNLPLVAASLFSLQIPVFADVPNMSANKHLVKQNDQVSAQGVDTYWTPERLKKAKPLELPVNIKGSILIGNQATPVGESKSAPGARPTVEVKPETTPLFTPDKPLKNNEVQPLNVGSQGAHFSSSRVFPQGIEQAYPYRTVGKLLFKTPQGDSMCSAAVLRPRLILTAGHCVHKGSGGNNGFYSNFLFIPAYRNGYAPYGKWTWGRVVTTNAWATGNGTVANAGDYAILELNDQPINGVTRKIGDVVGYLSYATNKLSPNHLHLLGYPGNLDSGEIMHQVASASYGSGGNNTILYGSDMGGGSSGGPWIQNFGEFASGQNVGQNNYPNQIVGVTSYGYRDANGNIAGLLVQGSSILDNQFTQILNIACAGKSGNC
ncbi:trypsin-like serine peptidase [Calothrix sp. 336/3]|uniref:trypsin-like serine peptidase n=1 Tax=Calothrix sp. 336/3 TaxID=1337936 RepID=UPI0004E38E98|nr:trypsin-like peptidase domain-containing protein [Calothrix sp. 336/3]AKG20424.1 hypothetical protein IJ00_02995 [Calothrix sp. 336/3]